MFCQRKTEYPTVMPFYGISTYGMLRKNFRIDELQCCSDVEVLVCKAVKKMFKCWRPKKKSAWTGLGKNKKASSAASVFNFLQDWSPGGRQSVLHFDGLPLTRGVVVATPFAAAVSLTFSLVKN